MFQIVGCGVRLLVVGWKFGVSGGRGGGDVVMQVTSDVFLAS